MNLPQPKTTYDADMQRAIKLADAANFKSGLDVRIQGTQGAARVPRLILTDVNGGRWSVLVSTSGVLSTVLTT